jgi:hypothetical protein
MNINVAKKQGLSEITLIVIVCVFLIALGFILLSMGSGKSERVKIPLTQEEIVWVKYENKDYQFELEYPEHWNVSENDSGVAPIIVFSPNKIGGEVGQFDNVDQVIIYPAGFPSEGLRGESVESGLDIQNGNESFDYILANNEVWATYSSFSDIPESWETYGFIWASVEIPDIEYSCADGLGNMIDINSCDPYSGNSFTRTGSFDNDIREIEERIIESLTFTK